MAVKNKIMAVIIASVLLFCIGLLAGCAPKGDPKNVLNNYYQNVMDGNFEAAYALISSDIQKSISKDDYILYQQLNREIEQFIKYKVQNGDSADGVKLNGVKYQYARQFTVTETIKSYYDNKTNSISHKVYLVAENNKWKVYWNHNIKQDIADNYDSLGWMYYEGKGKDRDLNQAAISFNDAIKTDPDYANAYYGLGVVYNELQRYDESIKVINQFITKIKSKSDLSDAYNLLGNNSAALGYYNQARNDYNKAIQLNPNNEYAKSNLKNLDS